ncbi:Peptidase S72 domain-containing protein [Aphelenchoides fujianensis]|nr:Peptidase S72 domain-containing protein [Aphelenchoides fujianensis]
MRSLHAALLAAILLLGPSVRAERQDAFIGQLFEFELPGDRVDQLMPPWIKFDADESKLYGIPRWDDFTNVTLTTANGVNVDVSLQAEVDPCEGKEYTFVEKYFEKDFNSQRLEDLRAAIKEFAEAFNVPVESVRAFSYADVLKYRKESGDALISPNRAPTPNQLVLWSRLGCGEAGDAHADVLEKASEADEMGDEIRAGQARVQVENVLALQTATPASSAARTTRAIVVDSPPVLFKKINTIECQRGILCHQWLPYNTFVDDKGQFPQLQPQVFSNGQHPNFLNITHEGGQVAVEGIALEAGTFNFRLQVRDKGNNVANAPFDVKIAETPRANHVFELLMDTNIQKYRDQPALLATFAHRLAKTVGGRPSDVLIESLEEAGSQTLLKFSNNSLSKKSCSNASIDDLRFKMVTRRNQVVINEFRKAMGADFHVKKVTVDLRDACASGGSTTTISIGNFRASTTTLRPESDEQTGVSTTTLLFIGLAALGALILVLAIICFIRKSKGNAYKKANTTEYSSKGHPVVFPDKMAAHEEDANGAAVVSTPMLVAHEHPPLQPTTTTQNPLYKPPSVEGTPTRNPTAPVGQRPPSSVQQPPLNARLSFGMTRGWKRHVITDQFVTQLRPLFLQSSPVPLLARFTPRGMLNARSFPRILRCAHRFRPPSPFVELPPRLPSFRSSGLLPLTHSFSALSSSSSFCV